MKQVKHFIHGAVLGLTLMAQSSYSATIGYVLLEQVQLDLKGVDLNLEADAESLIFDGETALLESASSASIVNHIEYLRSQGHTVHIYGSETDDILGIEHMEANNDVIIVSENPGSGTTGTFYAQGNIPVIICESFILDNYNLYTGSSERCFCDEDINAREFRVAQPGHPIVQGLPEKFAPLPTDSASGKPYVGNWSVFTEGDRIEASELDNVILTLVDPVAPIPQENPYILTDPVPVLWAFDVGEGAWGNKARHAFFGWGSENPTGVGLEGDPLFADGSTAGLYAFEVADENSYKLWDRIINWALNTGTPVEHWSVY
jgi:hypothetical protein